MTEYEKLGLFYLGKPYDLATHARLTEPLLYDSRDLLTHAVCVGMTGSGKTGLGITMIEEAAIDGIPVLAIDPKGDLANLLLTFPDLSTEDFLPWVDATQAGARQTTVETLASDEARKWKDGLAEWEQDGTRIKRLRAAAEVRVYTPGSRAGIPLALLKSLRAPTDTEDEEDAAARVASMAGSLLALAGFPDAAPHSREHALLAAILTDTATPGGAADLPWLVQQIQRPSFERVGVLDLETFFPARDRQDLALRFNSVLAAPGFSTWLAGEPLDIGSLLFTPQGRPRVAIVSIAHLGDAERMLVVSLLLNAVVEWTRRQTGTSSLRALVYMDEVFGYLPPTANPPSKLPLLTLLKQARAFGVGVMLATQNPVDLDYKALSNMGTWFLGKLQTERDKARVLDGIEAIGGGLDRQALDKTLSALGSRVFLMHNVHDHAPTVFETRWTLSYLRGPLGRDELKRLTRDSIPGQAAEGATPAVIVPPLPSHTRAAPSAAAAQSRPVLPAGIREVFLPGDGNGPVEYRPLLYGSARVHYSDTRHGIDAIADVHGITPFTAGVLPVDWTGATGIDVAPEALSTSPAAGASFTTVPAAALEPRKYFQWQRDFEQWVGRARPLRVFFAPLVKLTSEPGETERDFRVRMQQSVREARDGAVEALRSRYAPKVAKLTEKVQKAEAVVTREQQQVGQQKLQTAVSVGATMLGALLGRRAVSMSTLGRATTAARSVSRSMKESEDVDRARERLDEVQAELTTMQEELAGEIATLSTADPATVPIETVAITPKRGGIDVRLVALAWRPEVPDAVAK